MDFNENTKIESLQKRAELYLEDGKWEDAKNYYDKILDIDPECYQAYLGMLASELNIKWIDNIKFSDVPFEKLENFKKAYRFASDEKKRELDLLVSENKYLIANKIFNKEASVDEYKMAYNLFAELGDYEDSKEKSEQCQVKIKEALSKKEKGNVKTFKIILIVAIIAIIAFIAGSMIKQDMNRKLEEEIYNNFLGKTFSGNETIDSDNFLIKYQNNTLDNNTVYMLTEKEETLVFNMSESVDRIHISRTYPVAWPAWYEEDLGKPRETYSDGAENIGSFKITIDGEGKIWIYVGARKGQVIVDSNNVPEEILNYNEVDLRRSYS